MRQSRLLPLIIATALFMENTDSTVISTSLPMIAQSLGTDPIALKLALTSYLVSLAIPALVGPIVGPPLGGFITTYFDWRWIFFINIPIGVLGIVLATLYVPNIREDDTPPLDLVGFLLSGI